MQKFKIRLINDNVQYVLQYIANNLYTRGEILNACNLTPFHVSHTEFTHGHATIRIFLPDKNGTVQTKLLNVYNANKQN